MKHSRNVVRKFVFLAFGWALFLGAMWPTAAFAELKPSSSYVFLVNETGKVDKNRYPGKLAMAVSYGDLKAYLDENFSNHALYGRLTEELGKISTEKFSLEVDTDANRAPIMVAIRRGNDRAVVVGEAPANTNPTPKPQDSPMPQPRVVEEKKPNLPPPPNGSGPLTRQYVVVNRNITKEEKAAYPGGVECNFEQLSKVKETDTTRKEIHGKILEEVAKNNLQSVPFTIWWDEDSNKLPVTDLTINWNGTANVASIAVKKIVDPTDPELDLAAAGEAPTLASITAGMEDSAKTGTLPMKVLTWMISATPAEVKCTAKEGNIIFESKEVAAIFTKAGMQKVSNFQDNTIAGMLVPIANELRRDQRLALYAKKLDSASCLNTLYVAMWNHIMQSRRNFLLWDFKHVLEQLHAERGKLDFEGTTHSYKIEDPQLKLKALFVEEILMQFPSREIAQALPRKYRYDIVQDTNTENVDTRKEPIDILAYLFGADRYEEIGKIADIGTIRRTEIVKSAIKHALAPEWYPAEYIISKSTDEYARENGPNFFIFCSGGPLTVEGATADNISGNKLVQYFRIGETRLTELRARRGKVGMTCDGLAASLSVPEEYLKIQLKNPIDDTFRFGEDHKLKAVSTFFLVNAASPGFVQMMKLGSGIQGFQTVGESTPQDVKAAWLEDMVDTDFYFPAAHQTNAASFPIAYTGSSRLVLNKKMSDNKVIEVICYVPPTSGKGHQINVSDAEVAELFKKRRALAVQRRLYMMNIACGSKECVPYWSSSYEKSLIGQKFTPEQVELLPGEVPVFIGASRSFATNTSNDLLSHSKFPFTALEIAGGEKRLKDLLGYLGGTDFGAASNVADGKYFDVESQRVKISVLIVTAQGKRISY